MQKTSKAENILRGASVLTLTSLIAKILAALYRVPYQNLVGDAGFYVYQQVYPIYGIAMMLALGGLPMFLSKITVEAKDDDELSLMLGKCFMILSVISVALFLLLFFGSNFIAKSMGQIRLAPVVKMSAMSFLLTPFLSIFRGGFQGKLFMTPTGVSQVLEQLLRVAVIWFAAFGFATLDFSIYQTGTLAMSGSIIGGLVGCVVLFLYFRKSELLPIQFSKEIWRKKTPHHLFRRMIFEGGVMSVYSGFLVILQLVDSFTIKKGLQNFGMSESDAEITKGIFDRGQPLVQLGLIVALGLTSSFLPALTKNFLEKQEKSFQENARLLLKLSFTLGGAATVGLIALLPFINKTLFQDEKLNGTLSVFLLAIVLMVMIQALQSLAQSKGNYRFPLVIFLVGFVVKMMLTAPMTEHFGTFGASFSTIFTLLLVFLCFYFYERAYWLPVSFYVKTMISLVIMAGVLYVYRLFFQEITSRMATFALSLIGVILGGGIFVAAIFFMSVFDEKEQQKIPLIAQFLNKKNKK